MNTPLRRVSMAVMVLIVLLLGQATYIQVVKADEYRADPRNQRVLIDEYSRQRGQISAGGEILAQSVPSDGRLRYLRQYPEGETYAPVTGYYSQIFGSTGVERAANPVLDGTDDRLFVRRISDVISGRQPGGGNVVTTIDPRVQRVAYEQMASNGYSGSVVAIRPDTGEILAMVSTPSYDPNPLASHDAEDQQDAWDALNPDSPNSPLINQAISQTFPPGSTFKLVTAAAALSSDQIAPSTPVTAAPQITLPDSVTTLENYDGQRCGPGPTVDFATAFAKSCNAPFAELADRIGSDALRTQARAFGFDQQLQVPMTVTASDVGELGDQAALAQSGIGQRDVRITPLQNALITAAIANGGVPMAPHLVSQIQGQNLSVVDTTRPERMPRAVSSSVATTLTQLMIGSENNATGATSSGRIRGVQLASKTGTAEWGATPKVSPPHTWYDAFGPVADPEVAVSVIVERGGNRGDDATGASVAGPVGRAVIAAALGRGN